MGAFRYPGAKTKLAQQIVKAFPALFRTGPLFGHGAAPLDYREPFFGAGGVGLPVIASLPQGSRVWINDADPGIADYWHCVVERPEDLSARVAACTPSVSLYRDCLAQTEDPSLDPVTSAFCTLFLHQCSYSGLGKKAGSPIGGWDQDGTPKVYDVACRWNAPKLVRTIRQWHGVFQLHHVRVTCGDFAQVLTDVSIPERSVVYCDPPYVEQGAALYHIAMTEADHARLAQALHRLPCPWLLSYDDTALVRRLYHDCVITPIPVRYIVAQGAAQGKETAAVHELLITPAVTAPRPRWSLVVTGRTGYHYAALAQQSGLPASTIRNRVRRGKPLEDALRVPRRPYARGGVH